jgi:hypothetical protein
MRVIVASSAPAALRKIFEIFLAEWGAQAGRSRPEHPIQLEIEV